MGFEILNFKVLSLAYEGRWELWSSIGGRGCGVTWREGIIEMVERGGAVEVAFDVKVVHSATTPNCFKFHSSHDRQQRQFAPILFI